MEKTFLKAQVLLVYITVRSPAGHDGDPARPAAVAPNIEAPSINGFGYTYPILEKVVNRAYMSIIKDAQGLGYLDNPTSSRIHVHQEISV